jgi:hypothetical protein
LLHGSQKKERLQLLLSQNITGAGQTEGIVENTLVHAVIGFFSPLVGDLDDNSKTNLEC